MTSTCASSSSPAPLPPVPAAAAVAVVVTVPPVVTVLLVVVTVLAALPVVALPLVLLAALPVVVHALPPGLPHKGLAMMDLMLKLRLNAALYVGDPETGEELFEMADRPVVTVRVGATRRSWAPFYLKGHGEIAPAVTLIVRSLDCRAAAADRRARGAISTLSTGLNG